MELAGFSRPYCKPPAMRLTHTLLLLFFTTFLTAQSTPNEQTMARLAGELTARMNGKKLRKVAILRLSFKDDPNTPEGAWLADEMAFALQAAGPDFAVIPRADMEQKTADYAARQAEKASSSSTSEDGYDDGYAEEEYEEEVYSEEESYEEEYEEEAYEEYEEVNEKSVSSEEAYTEEESSTGTTNKTAKKKKNTGLLIGGTLLVAGATALLAGKKKPMAGVRATITGIIVEQSDQLVVTFRAVDRKGRVLGMTRGRFVREE